jgi:hypothetical protein
MYRSFEATKAILINKSTQLSKHLTHPLIPSQEGKLRDPSLGKVPEGRKGLTGTLITRSHLSPKDDVCSIEKIRNIPLIVTGIEVLAPPPSPSLL